MVLVLAHARAQQPATPRGVLTREVVLSRLRTTTPEQRAQVLQALTQTIRESGVDFELTPPVEQELTEAGATTQLLAAIRANFRPAPATQGAKSGAERRVNVERDS